MWPACERFSHTVGPCSERLYANTDLVSAGRGVRNLVFHIDGRNFRRVSAAAAADERAWIHQPGRQCDQSGVQPGSDARRVYRYGREKRVIWPLALLVVVGTTPGVVGGGFVRLSYLPDPRRFKVFVGLVLLWLGVRLLQDIWKSRNTVVAPSKAGECYARTVEFTWRRLVFEFRHQQYECKPAGVFVLSLVVGLIGGIYGI